MDERGVPPERDPGAIESQYSGNGSLCQRKISKLLINKIILTGEGRKSIESDPETFVGPSS